VRGDGPLPQRRVPDPRPDRHFARRVRP
jgi:hypothetical protein